MARSLIHATISISQDIKFDDKRSAKLSQDEFLQLLAAFNRAGIHFA